MISPAPESSEMGSLAPISMASVLLYPEFIQRVEQLSGQSVGYRKDGALDLLLNGTSQGEIDEILAVHRGAGLRAEALSGHEAREIEPGRQLARGRHLFEIFLNFVPEITEYVHVVVA